MACTLLTGGYKDISLTDVYRSVAFTLWLCGCNYSCPFCHNWRIACRDPSICKSVSVEEILSKLTQASHLVEYFHVTGGEPLLQAECLSVLLDSVRETGVKSSVNSNLSLPEKLEPLLSRGLIDHVAADLKIPFKEMTGLRDLAEQYWQRFKRSLEIVAEHDVVLELRIPVARELTLKSLHYYLAELSGVISKMRSVYCLVFPLVGKPIVDVRNPEWCREFCYPSLDELSAVKRSVEEILGVKAYMKHWWSVG